MAGLAALYWCVQATSYELRLWLIGHDTSGLMEVKNPLIASVGP
jgi:hypothetical protein